MKSLDNQDKKFVFEQMEKNIFETLEKMKNQLEKKSVKKFYINYEYLSLYFKFKKKIEIKSAWDV